MTDPARTNAARSEMLEAAILAGRAWGSVQLPTIVEGETCGATLEEAEDALSTVIDQLRAAVREYADHQSWRCEHAPHFYLANEADSKAIVARDDCYCGLRKTLRDLGVEA